MWTGNHHIADIVRPAASERDDVIDMIGSFFLVQFLATPITAAFLPIKLLTDFLSRICAFCLSLSGIIAMPSSIMFCQMCFNIGSTFRSKCFTVLLSIGAFYRNLSLYVMCPPVFIASTLTYFASRFQSINLSLVSSKILRGCRIWIVASKTLFQDIFIEYRGRFLVSLVCSFSVLFIHTFSANILKANPLPHKR